MIAFLKAHWRPVALVIALVAAFGAGRFAMPSKIHVVEVRTYHYETVQGKERVVFKDRVVQVDRVVTKVTSPDGTITEKIEDKSKRETKTTDASKEVVATSTDSSAKTDKLTVNDAPRFTVSLLAGVQIKSQVNLIPGAGPFSLGLQFQYRIIGPLQVGAWGLTTGAFGVSLGLTF